MANNIRIGSLGHPITEDLATVTVGGARTSLEISSIGNGVRVQGDLEVSGHIIGDFLYTDLTLDDIDCDDITCDDLTASGSAVTLQNMALTLDSEIQQITVTDWIHVFTDEGFKIYDKTDETIVFNFDIDAQFFAIYDDADQGDLFKIKLEANGVTTISTVDDDGHDDADLLLDIDGKITLDSATGEFVTKNAGTEFSVANSSFAGTILGYRCIGEAGSHATYTLTALFAVPDSDMTVRFIAPPSGAVEIMVQVFCNASTSNRIVYFGLSDNATYNTLGAGYEQIGYLPDETDDNVVQHYWTITGLTAGDTYNYWFGAKISATTGYLNWGGTSGNRYCDFIMKVTALPAVTADFAVYG